MDESPPSPRADARVTIITLVHGTWARGAEWIKDSSPLAEALKRDVQGEVRIAPFNWSGGNRHFKRRQAADDLRRVLESQVEEYPESRRFVIAHSHGGNVALYALNDPDIGEKITGTICLSTPFIHCRPRIFPEGTLLISYMILAVVFCLLLFRGVEVWPALTSEYLIIGALLAPMAVFLGVRWMASWLVLGTWRGKAGLYEDFAASVAVPDMPEDKLLIVRASSDEASLALGASTFGSWIFGKISGSFAAIHHAGTWVANFSRKMPGANRLLWGFCLIFVSILLTGFTDRDSLETLGMLLLVPAGCFLITTSEASGFAIFGLLLLALYPLLVLPCLLFSCLLAVPLGFDIAIMSTLFEFFVETSPVGNSKVIHLSSTNVRGLWHSLPYADEKAFLGMVEWINELNGSALPKEDAES